MNLKRRKVDFVIPPKTDNYIGLNLGYINGEYKNKFSDVGFGYYGGYAEGCDGDLGIIAFCGWLGNCVFSIISCIPFINLIKYVDCGDNKCKE